MLEVGWRVVAGAVFQLDVVAVELDGEVAEGTVLGLVGGVEAEDVVGLGVMLHLLEGGAKVVGVAEEFSAGICGERAEGFL